MIHRDVLFDSQLNVWFYTTKITFKLDVEELIEHEALEFMLYCELNNL